MSESQRGQQKMYKELSSLLDVDEDNDDDIDVDHSEELSSSRTVLATSSNANVAIEESSSTSSQKEQLQQNDSSSTISKFLDCGNSTCTSETIQDLMNISPRKKLQQGSGACSVNSISNGSSNHTDMNSNKESGGDDKNTSDDGKINDEDDGTLDLPMPFSDLSDPTRNVWIVTTAGLPWRTGTAINPFLRALYLVKRRLDLGLHMQEVSTDKSNTAIAQDDITDNTSDDIPASCTDCSNSTIIKAVTGGKITLVIPWLIHKSQSDKLYGPGIITKTGQAGQQEQIAWIQNYASEQCNMAEEMKYLHILFYDATYWPAFGSIFPSVDICNLIPNEEADVAILEEPEHLNWFRIPKTTINNVTATSIDSTSDGISSRNRSTSPSKRWNSNYNNNRKSHQDDNTDLHSTKINRAQHDSLAAMEEANEKSAGIRNEDSAIDNKNESRNISNNNNNQYDNNENDENDVSESTNEQKQNELGWAHKFNFVVGIIHTNYSAYMKQYGVGSSIIGAPALSAISTMVVRAYCHKVIRLSAVIPSYAKWKECTCNVHGVRGDFLAKDDLTTASSKNTSNNNTTNEVDDNDQHYAPIYFIGKLLWAKGFDKMLKVQELYRESNVNREYFPIDVYGGGPDETAIFRAFHGRLQSSTNSSPTKDSTNSLSIIGDNNIDNSSDVADTTSPSIFSKSTSIRQQLINLVHHNDIDDSPVQNDVKSYINMGFEVVDTKNKPTAQEVVVMERNVLVSNQDEVIVNPLSIISEVSGDIAATGVATTVAIKNLADTATKTGITMTFSQEQDINGEVYDIQTKPSFIFDPPKSLFELRRNPIPARFLGVKDHALLRNLPHKIFLNPSVTEVLCTTTAEALAMGKFVIIPDHPSNEFFLQFPNCLTYQSLHECVEKIKWALDHDPEPLSEEHAHILTWEAATDRLIQSSLITKREAKHWCKDGHDKGDLRMAWLHSEGGKKGQFIKTLFGKGERSRVESHPSATST